MAVSSESLERSFDAKMLGTNAVLLYAGCLSLPLHDPLRRFLAFECTAHFDTMLAKNPEAHRSQYHRKFPFMLI
jgi:hypothetical protein